MLPQLAGEAPGRAPESSAAASGPTEPVRAQRPGGGAYQLLLVDDERGNLELLARTLRTEGEVHTALGGEEAIEIVERLEIDLLITDQRMPRVTGVRVAEHLKARNPLAVRIILTGFTDSADLIDAINRGEVYRYLTKPWDPMDLRVTVRRALEDYGLRRDRASMIAELETKNAILQERNRQVAQLNADLEKQIEERTRALAEVNRRLTAAVGELSAIAQSDPVTGLWNARHLRHEIARELVRSRRFGRSFSLLYLDIDQFRRFNVDHGTAAGDRAMRVVAGILLAALRHSDAIGRYGEDEFVAVVPHASRADALPLAENICRTLAETGVPVDGGGVALALSASIGVVSFPEDGDDVDRLLTAGRTAAARALAAGGNRAV